MLDNIEAERGRIRMTKAALSERLHVTPKTYNGYIDGKCPIPHTILIDMSKLFGCSVDYLLGLSESRT